MAKIALNGTSISSSTASGHIDIRRWVPPTYDSEGNQTGGGYYIYSTTSATITGTANSSVSNVRIEDKTPITQGDSTTEKDSYSVPSGWSYYGGAHSGATGIVTGGNSSNVYVNGKSVAIVGSSVRTHANTNTTISSSRVSSTVNIG